MTEIETKIAETKSDTWKLIAQGLLGVILSVVTTLGVVNSMISSKIQTESPYATDKSVIMRSVEKLNDIEEALGEVQIAIAAITKLGDEVSAIGKIVTQLQVDQSQVKEMLERVRSVESIATELRVANASLEAKLDQLLSRDTRVRPNKD